MQESLFSLRENLLLEQPQRPDQRSGFLTQAAPDGGDSLLVSAVKRLSDRLRYHCATGRPRMGRCLLSAGAEASVYG